MKLKTQSIEQKDRFDTIFDDLLAVSDNQEALAEKRQEIIESFITDLDEQYQDRARKIQWRLDQELDKCKDSNARYNKMVELFWKQVSTFNYALNGKGKGLISNAEIIEFKPKSVS